VTDLVDNIGDQPSDEMSEYLQMFMDETEEQLEDLVEVLLVLEREPDSVDELNEAFRLIHSIKGSSGMMGFDNITMLTHHLESRFEAFRSGLARLDEPTMNLVLRCIDFLRECVQRLRANKTLGSAAVLLEELAASVQGKREAPRPPAATEQAAPETAASAAEDAPEAADVAGVAAMSSEEPPGESERYHLTIRFEQGLLLADLKARLIVARLSELGEIDSTNPSAGELETIENLSEFTVTFTSDRTADDIRDAVSLDGVHAIDFDGSGPSESAPAPEVAEEPEPVAVVEATSPEAEPEPTSVEPITRAPEPAPVASSAPAEPDFTPAETGKARTAETMRVEIDRLDSLMNLAGELVVNRARFVQVAGQVAPAFGKRNMVSRARDFAESLRRTVDHLQGMSGANGDLTRDIEELKAGLSLIEEQSELWDSGRRGFAQISEAIDQLTRISDSLQQSVRQEGESPDPRREDGARQAHD
jgi:two-component system chemotaxis sensor kinase CheA